MVKQDVLIGHTGFVGGNLNGQHQFGLLCNSKNTTDLVDGEFETVVCAAAPGSMIEANRASKTDAARIEALQENLSRLSTRNFILISTIAVLRRFDGADDETTTDFQLQTPYGVNRRSLEVFCQNQFENCLVIRLPSLFGDCLRKNFLFDIRNPAPSMLTPDAYDTLSQLFPTKLFSVLAGFYSRNEVTSMYVLDRAALGQSDCSVDIEVVLTDLAQTSLQFTHRNSTFQFYGLNNLWSDICRAQEAGLKILHLAPEPLRAADIYLHLTGQVMPQTQARVHHEDFRTQHSDLFSTQGEYIKSAEQVLDELKAWMKRGT